MRGELCAADTAVGSEAWRACPFADAYGGGFYGAHRCDLMRSIRGCSQLALPIGAGIEAGRWLLPAPQHSQRRRSLHFGAPLRCRASTTINTRLRWWPTVAL